MDAIHTIEDYERLHCYGWTNGWLLGMCKNIQIAKYIWPLCSTKHIQKHTMNSVVEHDAPIEVVNWLLNKISVSEKVYELALKKNRIDLIKLFHTKYPTTISTLIVQNEQLVTENTELKKDMEMYKSFYEHYHG